MSRLVTHGLGGTLLPTGGLMGSALADFFESLKQYWESSAILSALAPPYNTFPEPGTPPPYIVVQETFLRIDGQCAKNKSYWIENSYAFRSVDTDDNACRQTARQIESGLLNLRKSMPTFSDGYLMRWTLSGQIDFHEPDAAKKGAWIWHHGPVFMARIGRSNP